MHFFVGGQFRIENIAKLFEKILYCKVSFRLEIFKFESSKLNWKVRAESGKFLLLDTAL